MSASTNDLSAGGVSVQESQFVSWALEDRVERRRYRSLFTWIAIGAATLFYAALLCFVWLCVAGGAAMACTPLIYIPTLLILAAVPTGLLVRVMAYAVEPLPPEMKARTEKSATDGLLPTYELTRDLLSKVGEFIALIGKSTKPPG